MPEIMKTMLEPMVLAVAIAETVAEHFKEVERGDVPFPAYKATKDFGVVQIWKCTRLEVLRQMWGHGASKLVLLAEPTEQSKVLTAFFEDTPHLEFPHQPNNDPIHDTLQALFQVYLDLGKAGSAVVDPNTDRQSLKLVKKTIFDDFEREATSLRREWEAFRKQLRGSSELPPMPRTMLDILYEDVTAKTKTIALCAMYGPQYLAGIKHSEEVMAQEIKRRGASDRKVDKSVAAFRVKAQEVLDATDPDDVV